MAETLVAILICAFAMLALTTAVASAAKIDFATQSRDTAIEHQDAAAEAGSGWYSSSSPSSALGAAQAGSVVIAGKSYPASFFGGQYLYSYEMGAS